MDETKHPHGTPARYNGGGCRCQDCRDAWATYCRIRARRNGRPSRSQRAAIARMRLDPDAPVMLRHEAYYPDKGAPIQLRPTALGREILSALQRRTGRDYDDIVERLLRTGGEGLTFDDPPAA